MFEEKDVKNVYDLITDDDIKNDNKLKYIDNKIKKHDLLYINISELNYLYEKTNTKNKYNIKLLKEVFKNNNIGYTSIIRNIGIPKATLSKLFNDDRNVKLKYLNDLFTKANNIYNLNISKNTIKEGE